MTTKVTTVETSNPFVYNVPVVPAKFVGRERTLSLIGENLRSPNRPNIAVCGPLGIGKTSLLNYISEPEVTVQMGLDPETHILCHIDCQSLTEFTATGLWRRLIHCIAREVDGPLREAIDPLTKQDEVNFEDIQDLLDELEEADRPLIVLLDEFECLVRTHTPLAEQQTRHLLGMLSSLGRRTPRVFTMVMATERSPAALGRDLEVWRGSPFSTIFISQALPPFTESETTALLYRALAGTGVAFSAEERRLVYEETEGHPAQFQAAAAALFSAKQQGTLNGNLQTLVRQAVVDNRANDTPSAARGVWVDEKTGEAWIAGHRHDDLSRKEFNLLQMFCQNAGKLCTKDDIWAAVWPEYDEGMTDYAIHKMVSRLRQKIEPTPEQPQYILTVWGRGYKFAQN